MIKNGTDTVPYQPTIDVYEDTFESINKTYLPGDTSLIYPCDFFEILDGKVINQRKQCDSVGYWILELENGYTISGHFSSAGDRMGTWRIVNLNNKLIEEIEYVHGRMIAKYNYPNGKRTLVFKENLIKTLYLKFALPFWLTWIVLFFSRIFVNSHIYNSKNRTNYSVIYFNIGPFFTNRNNFLHSIKCTYTFWWNLKKLQVENIPYARFINVCTIILSLTIVPLIIVGNLGYLE